MPKVTKKIKAKPKQSSKSITSEQKRIDKINSLKEQLLIRRSLNEKLKIITEGIVDIFDADFARIWMVKKSDICEKDCFHATVTEGPHVCRDRSCCLHLIASSGRYTHIDGGHKRVPLGCYKIGRVASGEDPYFVTNDVTHDLRVHDHKWAKNLGLVSFAGFRLLSAEGNPIGVLALFSKHEIVPDEERLLQDIANTTSQVILAGIAEESLRESEKKYKTLTENSLTGVFIHQEGKFVFVNERFAEIHGYKPEELLGVDHLQLILPDEREKLRERASKRLEGESIPKRYEVRRIRKDGEVIWCEMMATRIQYQGRSAIMGNVTDITWRKEAEEKLRKSQEFFMTIINSMNDAVSVISTQDFRLVDFNKVFSDWVGMKKNDITGKACYEITHKSTHPCTPPEHICPLMETLKTGESSIVEHEHYRGSEKCYVEISTSSIKNEKGETIQVVHVAKDITDRKRAEESLQESEKKLKNIVEHSNEVFYIHDTNNKLYYVSPQSLAIFGYTPAEMMVEWTTLVTENPINKLGLELTEKAIKTGERQSPYLLEVNRKDKSKIMIKIDESPLKDSTGNVIGIVGAARDITNRIQDEEELKKREAELKKKVKELEEFYRMAVNRELKMIELKKEIEELQKELEKYKNP